MKKRLFFLLSALFLALPALSLTALAELMDMDAGPVPVVSGGSFAATSGTRMDFGVLGGTLTGAQGSSWSHYASYSLTGTFKEGETVSLSVTGSEAPGLAESPTQHLVWNYLSGYIEFWDGGTKMGETERYASERVESASLSHVFTATAPAGATDVVIRASFSCRWSVDYSLVVVEEFVAVDLSLKAEVAEAPPAATSQEPEPSPDFTPEPSREPEPPLASKTPSASEQAPGPREKDAHHGKSPWAHAGPLATVLVAVAAALAAVLGAGAGAAAGDAGAESAAPGGPDPAYEAAKVPDYPGFVVGRDGERITRMPGGLIEAAHPNGDVATHFPNGTVQVRSPDGTTWEEWPDGTVSATDEDGTFIVKTTDGTLSAREPTGDEIIYYPDGTQVETKIGGLKITRNAEGETVTVERNGTVMRRHPTEPDAFIMTFPKGGSLVVRTETGQTPPSGPDAEPVERITLEGEIRLEDATCIYRPDGSREVHGDDGSHYAEQADGSFDASSPDGTDLKYNARTGEGQFQFADGSFAKINAQTGEIDARLQDGSYWKRDARGNGSFVDKENGTRGVCREDGSFEMESGDDTFAQEADGTMKLQTGDGTTLTEKSDGTVTLRDKDGASLTRNPDGTGFLRKPDGTVVPLPPLPR